MKMRTYEVDMAMCGSDLPDGFDLRDFCDVLEGLMEGAGQEVAVVAHTGSWNGAAANGWQPAPGLWHEALKTYCSRLDAVEG
jgi:hypothetical protein